MLPPLENSTKKDDQRQLRRLLPGIVADLQLKGHPRRAARRIADEWCTMLLAAREIQRLAG